MMPVMTPVVLFCPNLASPGFREFFSNPVKNFERISRQFRGNRVLGTKSITVTITVTITGTITNHYRPLQNHCRIITESLQIITITITCNGNGPDPLRDGGTPP